MITILGVIVMIKKFIFLIGLVFFASVLFCTKQKDYSDIENVMNRWANSIRYLNYAEYSKIEANPKDINTFNVMYQRYYISNIKIVEVDDVMHKGTDSEGQSYKFKNVKFIAIIYKRDTGKEEQIVNGDVKLIRYISGKKKEKGWLLSNKTMVYHQ